MSNLRHNRNVTMETIHKLCLILNCTPNDIVEIIPDKLTP
ncbi:MAG: helix-turn-helix transcriptional regulator [Lachnospiraceae bacterium]|nr:helix-turn-helix transcriptional regulator [Lachnospiraceae bacterium]